MEINNSTDESDDTDVIMYGKNYRTKYCSKINIINQIDII